MKAMYIHDSIREPFTALILAGWKVFETRTRDMLRPLVGERVAIIRTGSGLPMIVGYADVVSGEKVDAVSFASPQMTGLHRVFPDSKYFPRDNSGRWLYLLKNVERLPVPEPVPACVVRHGRSWCEF